MTARRCFALAFALTLGLAQAQDDAHRAKVRRYLEVSGRTAFGEALLADTVAKLAEEPMLPPGLLDAFKQAAKPAALADRLLEIYADLDDEALDAAIAFYETPAGKRVAKLQAKHDAATQVAAGEWIQESLRQAMKQQGIPTPEENLREARRHGNEAAAIGALKTMSTAQALFREGDKDKDGNFQYAGDLAALGKAKLIDEVLASGTKLGYRYELCASSETPEFLWMAVASPTDGEGRHFVINQSGVIYYSKDTPFKLDRKTCKIPEGAVPVGT